MIYFAFPFLLTPECQIAAGSLTSLLFTLHTSEAVGGCLTWYSMAQFGLTASKAPGRYCLRRWNKQLWFTSLLFCHEGGRYVCYSGLWSPWERPAAHVARSQLSQRSNGTGKQLEVEVWNTHRVYNRKTHTYTKPTHTIWHPLLLSSRICFLEPCRRNTTCAVQPSCYS